MKFLELLFILIVFIVTQSADNFFGFGLAKKPSQESQRLCRDGMILHYDKYNSPCERLLADMFKWNLCIYYTLYWINTREVGSRLRILTKFFIFFQKKSRHKYGNTFSILIRNFHLFLFWKFFLLLAERATTHLQSRTTKLGLVRCANLLGSHSS